MVRLPCREAKEELERMLSISSTQTAPACSHSQSNAWAAFTSAHGVSAATAAAQPRPTTSSLGGDAAAWGSRPRTAAAKSAWGAATAAPACTLHTGLRQARAAEAQLQPHLHAQSAACSGSSGGVDPDQGSDSGSAPLPSPARAADVQTSWNPLPRGRQQCHAPQLFATQQGGSLPTSFAAARSQPSSLPASAPQPASRLDTWLDAVPPSPPLDRRADRHACSSWSPARRQSQLPTYVAGAPPTSPPQSQRGWLPPPRARQPLTAAAGMFADDVGCGPSSPVMCSLPDSSQRGGQGISGRSGGCDSPIALDTSGSEGAAAARGLGSAPADVLDDEAPLAEFHWASQARSSMSQPLPSGRRRSSVTTGSRPGGYGLGDEHGHKFERSTPRRQPLQAANRVSEWLHSTSNSPLQRRGGAAARRGEDGQDMLLAHNSSPDNSKARSETFLMDDCQGTRTFDMHACMHDIMDNADVR